MTTTPATLRTRILARLIEVHHELDERLRQLEALGRRLESARRYLATPGGNPHLGRACLVRVESEREAMIAELRATRREAHRLLGHAGPESGRRIA